jgi:hypothetical protein
MNIHRINMTIAAAFLLAAAAVAQNRIDLAGQSVLQLDARATSADVAVHGVTAGMSWDEARGLLDDSRLPYLVSKGARRTVYIPPLDPSMEMDIDIDGCISEIRLSVDAPVAPCNRYLLSPARWKLTTARTYFFGSEGEEVRGRCRCGFVWPDRGFALRYGCGGAFAFVLTRTGPRREPPAAGRDTVYVRELVFAERQQQPVLQVSFDCFISGWYQPSTERGVSVFKARSAGGGFREAPYIKDDDPSCSGSAPQLSGRMAGFVKSVQEAVGRIQDSGSCVYFYVSGYTDERELRPGKYVDESVSFGPMSISKGARLAGSAGNVELSWLRAYYTREELLSALHTSSEFNALEKQGRVIWELHGLGIDHSKKPMREKRRVDVRVHMQ